MANITKEQLKQILMDAPDGTSAPGIIASLRERGHTLEGYEKEEKKPVSDKTLDILSSIFPGRQIGEALGASIVGAKELIGGKTLEEATQAMGGQVSPLQVGADVAGVALTGAGLTGVGQAGGLLARTAVSSGLGAGLSGTKAIAEEKTPQEIKTATITGGAIGAAIPLIGEGIKQFGKLLGGAGKKIQITIIKPTKADIQDGFKIANVSKYNVGGSLKSSFEKTDNLMDSLSKELNQKLRDSNTAVDLNKVYENTAKRILGNKLESFGANSSIDSALENLRGEIVTVTGPNGVVTVPEAQMVKRASGHFGAWLYGQIDPESSARQKVYNVFYNEMKTAIEKSSPQGVQEINKKLSDLIPIMNALIRRIPVAERNSALSLTDIITLSAATLEPRALSLTLLNLASKSGIAAKGLTKLGGALEKTGPIRTTIGRVARTVLPIINQP